MADFPNAEKTYYQYQGVDSQLKIAEGVTLLYSVDGICCTYTCHVIDLYPNIASGSSRITKDDFENYLGLSVGFASRAENEENGSELATASLSYGHQGYKFIVFCEDDGAIIPDETLVEVFGNIY